MKVIVTAVPRKEHPGFGAIGKYFLGGHPTELDVDEKQLKELTSDPAVAFLKVEQLEKPKGEKK